MYMYMQMCVYTYIHIIYIYIYIYICIAAAARWLGGRGRPWGWVRRRSSAGALAQTNDMVSKCGRNEVQMGQNDVQNDVSRPK